MRSRVLGFVAAVAIGLGVAPAARAADMPLKAPPPPPAPIANWTGFYVGGNAGYVVEHDSSGVTNFTQPAPVFTTPMPTSTSATSFTGGVQGGYNWQFTSRWLLGVEGDWNATRPSTSLCRPTDLGAPCADTGRGFLNMSEKTDWLASVRGRLGWVWDSFLFYGTAGAAWGKVDTTLNANCLVGGCGNSLVPSATTGTFSNTASGWVAGAGVEAMLWGNWTGRFEWLHYNLGGLNNTFTAPPAVGSYGASWNRNLEYDTVRFGLNYRFLW
jgi:outer membrane immunogenic protein